MRPTLTPPDETSFVMPPLLILGEGNQKAEQGSRISSSYLLLAFLVSWWFNFLSANPKSKI